MACYSPWSVEGADVKRLFSCGKCHGCQLEKARQWAVRCMHEASLHDTNCFVTLTFKEAIWSLDHKYFQDFMKRLRFKFRPRSIRYFMSGEYGAENSRAHFHVCLFNHDFPDRVYFKLSPSGSKLYRSAVLEKLWPFGYSSIGMVTFDSAAYVARYSMKKVAWVGNDLHDILDPETGEIFRREPEYIEMSRRPAIGKEWIKRFRRDVYPGGKVLVDGVEARAPRFYDKFFRSVDAGGYMKLCVERKEDVSRVFSETLPDRLVAREKVSKALLSFSKSKI